MDAFFKLAPIIKQTKIKTIDGYTMVLFHSEEFTEEELKELSRCTYDELKSIVWGEVGDERSSN